MKELLNNILAAVTKELDALFAPLPVFGDEVPQELPDRCFIVSLEDVDGRKAYGRRYELKGTVDIAYYSPVMALDRDREHNEIYARCFLEIGVIEFADLKFALSQKSKSDSGGALHIRSPFLLHLYAIADDPLISSITIQKQEVKK
ncbi:hypothetical protein LJC27_01845 [Christensenellaceae bacterium OttesenSCG-928-M15]|nr:hypothetical protein [Christensenellaceae bacterium OttesenSCG-928-M15]